MRHIRAFDIYILVLNVWEKNNPVFNLSILILAISFNQIDQILDIKVINLCIR